MCDEIQRGVGELPEVTRRQLLRTLGTSAAVAGSAVMVPRAAHADPNGHGRDSSKYRTRVVLLGTGGGPALLNPDRLGVSTAVVYDGKVYLVDLGLGTHMQMFKAGLGHTEAGGRAFANIRGIFITHMHSDHVAEWPALVATGLGNRGSAVTTPIRVFGPGDRGTLPRVFPPGRPAPEVISPDDPTPGIVGMSQHIERAFASDFNDRTRDGASPNPMSAFDVHEIDITSLWEVDEQGIPPLLADPVIPVWEDGDVQITATLVDHNPTAPAFAYRFDTPDGSVVVSGDSHPHPNLIGLAATADYLVHEVIDRRFAEWLGETIGGEAGEATKNHLLGSHTTIEQVGRDVAEAAGTRNLLLTHIVPPNADPKALRRAQDGYSGRLHVGADLMSLGVGHH